MLSLALALALAPQDLVVTGGRLFDATSDDARANPGVLVRGGRIARVGGIDADEAEGLATLELAGDETLLPGFFDLHAHHAVDLFERGRRDETRAMPALYLANGVTSVFPAGEVDPHDMRAMRLRIDAGEQVGPRVHNSGPYFGRWRRGWDRDATAEEIAAEVDRWAALGVRGFKAKGISAPHLEALIERAHAHGLTVTGHLGSGHRGSVNPRDAIRMGIDRVEHFLGGDQLPADRSAYDSLVDVDVDAPEFRAICRLYVERNVYFDATLSAYGYYGERDPEVFAPWVDERAFLTPFVREMLADRPPRPPMDLFERIYWKKRETLAGFRRHGGAHLVTVGTDHPSWGDYLAPFGYHRELHCLALAGLEPAEVLRAATINGARALGVGDRLGTVEPGKWADLVVVGGDPLVDVRRARDVRHVVRGGVPHDPAELLRGARDTIGPRGPDELNDW